MPRRAAAVLPILLSIALLVTFLPGAAVGHVGGFKHNWTKHYKPLAKKSFYTKVASNTRFLGIAATAADAELLDGIDSSAFAASSHTHAGGDITSGTVDAARIDNAIARVADVLPTVLAGDGSGSGLDADLLDGQSANAFAGSSHNHAGGDITSGTVDATRIDGAIARDSEVFGIVTGADGSGSGLDADLLDGQSANAFAGSSHNHAGGDITSGTVDAARIDAAIARVADVFSTVLAADGTGSTLDADLLDGQSSNAFAASSHNHAGGDITSGTVADARIDAALTRDSEVFGIVTGADGSGSGLDADLLDGQNSGAFAASSHNHSGGDITSGTVDAVRIDAAIARVADVFTTVLAADGSGSGLDADLLDGQSAAAFQVAAATPIQWFKESADSLATTVTAERVVFVAPAGITITDVFVQPATALTANNTNYATITVARRNAGGGGKSTVATATTQVTGTGNWTAFTAVSLGSLTNTTLTDGQMITVEITKTGLGVAVPIMVLQVEYTVN